MNRSHPAFNRNAEPFYAVIMDGLKGEVDGEHFWDAVAENAIFEFLYNLPDLLTRSKGVRRIWTGLGGIPMSSIRLTIYECTNQPSQKM